jgi:glycosyltransferase involved in cell wall biosynthesis
MSDSALHDMRHRDVVEPVADNVVRPFWSVMIPTYNCGAYLRQTLASVLSQDQGPDRMQIEVVDDASDSDEPRAIVEELGGGRVTFTRQPANVGHIANFHTCLQRARGEVVHLLHGDDLVGPGYYEALERGFRTSPQIGAAFCRARLIDETGEELSTTEQEEDRAGPLPNHLIRLAREQRIMTPSIAVRRDAYVELGGFDPRPLASYRMHVHSNTGRHIRSGADMAYTRRAMDIFAHYLPPADRRSTVRRARQTYAKAALAMARRVAGSGDVPAALAQAWQAIRFRPSPGVARAGLGAVLRSLLRAGET